MCDTDGSGAISQSEFQAALYACDPVTGNSAGFAPTRMLLPKDAFEVRRRLSRKCRLRSV